MSDQPKRTLIYCRQSITTVDAKDSLSLIGQERALRALVERDGGIVLEPPIIDADEKGWSQDRPGIAELIERTKSERPDYIAIYAMSRLSRDNWYAEGLWRKLVSLQQTLTLRSVTEPGIQDDLMRGILGVISEAERKRIGAFMRSAFATRAHQGKPHGPAPFGFVKDDNGRLVIDDDARPWIEAIFQHVEDGWSLWRIARWLRDTAPPVRKWEPVTVTNLLRSPAMAGGVRITSTLTWDAHEPIIDRGRWDRVQTLLDTRRRIRTKNAASWLEGIFRCGCGAPMSLSAGINGKPDRFRCLHDPTTGYFRGAYPPPVCTSSPRSITRAKAERLAAAALVHDLDQLMDWQDVTARAERIYQAGARDRGKDRTALERQFARLSSQRDRVLDLYKLNKLDIDRWEDEDTKLAAQIAAVQERLCAMPEPPDARSIKARVSELATIRAALPELIAVDPVGARRYVQAVGACFVLGKDALAIDWPADYAVMLGG